MDSSDI